jgi:hypothetical protein
VSSAFGMAGRNRSRGLLAACTRRTSGGRTTGRGGFRVLHGRIRAAAACSNSRNAGPICRAGKSPGCETRDSSPSSRPPPNPRPRGERSWREGCRSGRGFNLEYARRLARLELFEQAERVLFDAVSDETAPIRDRVRAAFYILDTVPPPDWWPGRRGAGTSCAGT